MKNFVLLFALLFAFASCTSDNIAVEQRKRPGTGLINLSNTLTLYPASQTDIYYIYKDEVWFNSHYYYWNGLPNPNLYNSGTAVQQPINFFTTYSFIPGEFAFCVELDSPANVSLHFYDWVVPNFPSIVAICPFHNEVMDYDHDYDFVAGKHRYYFFTQYNFFNVDLEYEFSTMAPIAVKIEWQ